ncbi:hypothetical protein EN828_10245 [Mesorhizobium sp. M2D.F.Ca.ET.185.01.1.1]|uniref:hypothetical protein n=1 Tax=unclassified Mesorhizobium TaxID=325217 RepID=UPI000FD83C9A|nr:MULTISPECIES: hypothetical protein [unclassified Mesorhizobium]TGQ89416.1 hypothetical protein EN849_09745 [Mesorhizobium sp. M2D.F.Ca.ET.206.01.1.1]TGS32581.1 hypothetical protein EN828_10245 [Mesorhizobium sp. M2D.F.Ca.ET.185.01.1.1]TGU23671.1 hypothetical protein EN796_009795 [Mesorhizobium sp. M2D.F.Ca.ET.153.01.1.1]
MTMPDLEKIEAELRAGLDRATRLGFEGYCTDCENVTRLHGGRCGCGSGRVVTEESLRRAALSEEKGT